MDAAGTTTQHRLKTHKNASSVVASGRAEQSRRTQGAETHKTPETHKGQELRKTPKPETTNH